MSFNLPITLDGQEDIVLEDINLAEGGKFYIGGRVEPERVLASRADGTLFYSQNDYRSDQISNDDQTQMITCGLVETTMKGQMNFYDTNPILIAGDYQDEFFIGVRNGVLGYYDATTGTPTLIENGLIKVQCLGSSILFVGLCEFQTLTPFKFLTQPEAISGQFLKCVDDGGILKMKWVSESSSLEAGTNINITDNKINLNNDISIGGLIIDKNDSPALTTLRNLGQSYLNQGVNLPYINIYKDVSDELPIFGNKTILINGILPEPRNVLTFDENSEVIFGSYQDVGHQYTSGNDLLTIDNTLDVITMTKIPTFDDVLITYNGSPFSLICEGHASFKKSVVIPAIDLIYNPDFSGLSPTILINGVAGASNEVLGYDANGKSRFVLFSEISPPSPPPHTLLTAGLNIDGSLLSTGVIATIDTPIFMGCVIKNIIDINHLNFRPNVSSVPMVSIDSAKPLTNKEGYLFVKRNNSEIVYSNPLECKEYPYQPYNPPAPPSTNYGWSNKIDIDNDPALLTKNTANWIIPDTAKWLNEILPAIGKSAIRLPFPSASQGNYRASLTFNNLLTDTTSTSITNVGYLAIGIPSGAMVGKLTLTMDNHDLATNFFPDRFTKTSYFLTESDGIRQIRFNSFGVNSTNSFLPQNNNAIAVKTIEKFELSYVGKSYVIVNIEATGQTDALPYATYKTSGAFSTTALI